MKTLAKWALRLVGGLALLALLGVAPPLVVVAGYGPEQFARLMSTGEPVGDRELDLMRRVSLSRFSHFTEPEVTALYAYLRERVAGS